MSELTTPLLMVDDDPTFLRILQQAFKHHQIATVTAHSPQEALPLLQSHTFQYAILDLNLDGESGLNLMKELLSKHPQCKVLILTGYASVATAVEAMRLGAIDYLCKPASIGDILKALDLNPETNSNNEAAVLEEESDEFQPMSVKRLEWEHIQKTLIEHEGNISATAQALNMHRRTLQRKLQKRPVEK
ncbi:MULTISPECIES: response regulator transcription factor [Thiomicrorhabdus]|uniref:Response regulator transcription factor n=1 Tax=Thiomicrorhabdus heinhorstiae TaxID=2748010 RepID=A0ABS0C4E9_9GAMM|nr:MULTISPECIES: response regulator transcription factor [Thiomicrorhabdus]MBF6059117.1 response regulator transcription factor [Thiomicrorhabdus heinhorstiae]